MDDTRADRAQAQLRAGVYGRLSETYDAAESVPTQLDRGAGHARRRGWTVVATFKDDGYSAFKEITRDGSTWPSPVTGTHTFISAGLLVGAGPGQALRRYPDTDQIRCYSMLCTSDHAAYLR